MGDYEFLDFDTQLFGFKVARLLKHRLTLEELQQLLSDLKKQNVRLVYWATDPTDEKTQQAARALQGTLVDRKVTYVVTLKDLDCSTLEKNQKLTKEYQPSMSLEELEALAIQVGERSRFGVDPKMPRDCMEKMYREWIHNSVNHTLARHVLVIEQDHHLAGMITLGEKNNRGDIGLIATSEAARGRGLGKVLVQAAQAQFIKEGYTQSQVVTQQANVAACHLYERCGYTLERVEHFYHFWI
jgi:dTDP-4-amino-4,6-dideoxy-D-galactose acyltransferase